MENREVINDVLVHLFNEIMELEEQAIITEEYKDITNNDMHVIEAIGIGAPKNMSAIARELSVTVGTLTIAMNSLVKRGTWCGPGERKIGGSSISPCQIRAAGLTSITQSFIGR